MLLYTQTIEDPRQTRQFEDIYTACRGRLLALARRKLCGGAEAEDAVHQAFLALAEHFQRLCRLPRPQLEAYLVVVTACPLTRTPFWSRRRLAATRWPTPWAACRPAAERRCCCATAAATAPVRRHPCWSCPLPRPRSFCSGPRPPCVQNWKRRAYLYEHSAQ